VCVVAGRHTRFNIGGTLLSFDLTPVVANWRYLAMGLGVTLALSLLTMVAATILGTVAALARLYGPRWLSILLAFYVDSSRSVPVLVVLVWTFFAFPLVVGFTMPPFWAAFLALSVYVAAYISEIVRAGMLSIRPGQTRAAMALGMSRMQTIFRILLPQAAIRMLPPYGNMLSITIKNSAISSVIAVPDFMRASAVVADQSYRPLELYTAAIVVFFLIIFPVTRATDFVYSRVAHLGRS
jgi:polar amino acid transport system permease protein